VKGWAFTAVMATVAVLGVGLGGYAVGKSSGEDLSAARSAGQQQGRDRGIKRGAEVGTQDGFSAGRRAGFRHSYKTAYRAAYRKALAVRTPSRPPGHTVANDCASTGAEPNISGLSVRGMTCGQAQGVISSFGAISAHFTVVGFSCDRLSGGDLGGTWRCARGASAFRFLFGD
jgi:hypothetical protein